MPPDDRPQRVTLPTLQILAAFMSDLARDDWYGRALSVYTGLGSGTVLQCLYRLESLGWLESRWGGQDVATRDGRPPRHRHSVQQGTCRTRSLVLSVGLRVYHQRWWRCERMSAPRVSGTPMTS